MLKSVDFDNDNRKTTQRTIKKISYITNIKTILTHITSKFYSQLTLHREEKRGEVLGRRKENRALTREDDRSFYGMNHKGKKTGKRESKTTTED